MVKFVEVEYLSEEDLTVTEYEAYMDAKEEKLMREWDECLNAEYEFETAKAQYELAEVEYRRCGGEHNRHASDYWHEVMMSWAKTMDDLEKGVA